MRKKEKSWEKRARSEERERERQIGRIFSTVGRGGLPTPFPLLPPPLFMGRQGRGKREMSPNNLPFLLMPTAGREDEKKGLLLASIFVPFL